jgi:hypothetical protein
VKLIQADKNKNEKGDASPAPHLPAPLPLCILQNFMDFTRWFYTSLEVPAIPVHNNQDLF